MKKFLMAGDNWIPEMHLRWPGVLYSASTPFTKKQNKSKEIQSIRRLQVYRN